MQTFTRFEKFLLIDATFFRKILFKKCKKYTFAFLCVNMHLNDCGAIAAFKAEYYKRTGDHCLIYYPRLKQQLFTVGVKINNTIKSKAQL